jgi:hypothetical protein
VRCSIPSEVARFRGSDFPCGPSVPVQVSPHPAEDGFACSVARLVPPHGGRLGSPEAVRHNQAVIAAPPRGGGSPADGRVGEGSCASELLRFRVIRLTTVRRPSSPFLGVAVTEFVVSGVHLDCSSWWRRVCMRPPRSRLSGWTSWRSLTR